ncbi:MAG: YdcF family protein [Firmicutes bacterium]|nr:YdcF family protein [Bacillota bacterium]
MKTRRRFVITAVLLALALAAVSVAVILISGRTITCNFRLLEPPASAEDVVVVMDKPNLEEVSRRLEGDQFYVTYRGTAVGTVYLAIEKSVSGRVLYIHKTGFLTENTFLGPTNGDWIIHVSILIYLVFLFAVLLRAYRRNVKESIYQYRNITYFGILLYLASLIIRHVNYLLQRGSMESTISGLISSGTYAVLSLPLVLIVSVLVMISNIKLVRKEGKSIRNMLGLILGMVLSFGIIIPVQIGELLQTSSWILPYIDVHNMNGIALYIEIFLEQMSFTLVTYGELLLISTIVFALRVARHIPSFDKDAIAILGCQIRDDGTLTKLLQSRVDRALEFARMQKEAAGKDILFIPSGGKGGDEPVSEAEAMRNYLLEQGVPEEKIAMDDKSADTFENIEFSHRVMEERIPGGKMAFSTTNYHVLRAGIYAHNQGISAEGIGAPTKAYFWINAFIREFIAAFDANLKGHLIVLSGITIVTAGLTVLYYLINN